MVGLRQEGVAWGWGVCLKYLKREWNRKEERGNKDFKRALLKSLFPLPCFPRGANWVKGWVPWRRGGTNYALSFHTVFQVFKVLKNLLDSYSYIFVTNLNVITKTLTPTPSYQPESAKHDKKFFVVEPSWLMLRNYKKWVQHKCFQILQVRNISCKYKILLWKQYFVVF